MVTKGVWIAVVLLVVYAGIITSGVWYALRAMLECFGCEEETETGEEDR